MIEKKDLAIAFLYGGVLGVFMYAFAGIAGTLLPVIDSTFGAVFGFIAGSCYKLLDDM